MNEVILLQKLQTSSRSCLESFGSSEVRTFAEIKDELFCMAKAFIHEIVKAYLGLVNEAILNDKVYRRKKDCS